MNELRLRPLTLGDIFDEGFDLYKRNLPLLVLVTALVAVPLKIAAAWASLQFTGTARGLTAIFGGTDVPDLSVMWARLFDMAGTLAVFLPLYVVGYGLLTAGLASASAACYLGHSITAWGAYRPVLKRSLPLIVTAVLWGLAVGTGYLFCFVGAILPITWYAFTAHAFAVEGKNNLSALKRSGTLVANFGGRLWGALLLLALVSLVLSLGVELPLAFVLQKILSAVPGGDAWLGGGSLVGGTSLRRQVVQETADGLSQLFAAPFLMCTLTVFYFDLRVRKEAWDVERLAQGLGYPTGGPVPAGFPPPVAPPPPLRPVRPVKPVKAKRGAA